MQHADVIRDSPLSNGDLAPTTPERRTWGTHHLATLWVGPSIVITTYVALSAAARTEPSTAAVTE